MFAARRYDVSKGEADKRKTVQRKPEGTPPSPINPIWHYLATSGLRMQAKMKIGQPGDKYEQEADRVAEQVMRMSEPQVRRTALHRQPLEEQEEIQVKSLVQRKMNGDEAAQAGVESAVQSVRGQGKPLENEIRGRMEHAFGTDFSGVRVHTDGHADSLNHAVQARAFATGQDIFFRQGEYQPENRSGKELLVHELTHVVQQMNRIQTNYIERHVTERLMRSPAEPLAQDFGFNNIKVSLATDQEADSIGHTWIIIHTPDGGEDSYGFWPKDSGILRFLGGSILGGWYDGCVHNPDKSHKADTIYSSMTGLQGLRKGVEYANSHRNATYHLLLFNCATFARTMFEVSTGKVAPPGGLLIDSPNELAEKIKKLPSYPAPAPAPRVSPTSPPPPMVDEIGKKNLVQRKMNGDGVVPAGVEFALQSVRGQGAVCAQGSDEGKRLVAHGLMHIGQQREGHAVQDRDKRGSSTKPKWIARQTIEEESTSDGGQVLEQPYMGSTSDLGDVDTQPVEFMNTVGVVDVPITSLYERKPPYTPVATVTKGATLVVKGIIRPSDASKMPMYVVQYHGRMVMKQSEQVEVLILLSDLAVSSQGLATTQASEVQAANDWMAIVPDKGQQGNRQVLKPVLTQIRDARAAIEERNLSYVAKKPPDQPREGYKSEVDDKTSEYDKWLRNEDTHPRLAKSAADIRWNVLRRFFAAEGRPSDMMTYDRTNITWGPGFAGMGVAGFTEQAMARLFSQSQEAKDAFWKVGITVADVDLVMVNITDADKGIGDKLHGTRAENVLRLDKKLLSFFINVSQGVTEPGQTDPSESLRQDVLDAHFETFLNTTLRGSEGIIERMEEMAAAVAAHAVHTGNHGWGEFHGATTLSEVEGRINAQIANLKRREAKGEKVGYIVPLYHIKRNLERKFIDE